MPKGRRASGNVEAPEALPTAPLAAFLDRHELGSGELEVSLIVGGHSNLTYRLRREGADLVLRRPPAGPLAPSTHDVLREHRILAAIGDRARVPRVVAASADAAVIGAPFYLMEFVDGIVLASDAEEFFEADADAPAAVMRALTETLHEIHSIDIRAVGLDGLSQPGRFPHRQLDGLARLLERNRTRPLPDVDRVAAWLAENVPANADAALVHGDYRLGNILFARTPPARLLAVLDWELASIGDPLADLGYLLATYARPGEDSMFARFNPTTTMPGFPSRAAVAETYADVSGRPIDGLRWYEVFALWKLAIVLEGSYRRHLDGSADGSFFSDLEWGVPDLAARARALAHTPGD